MNRDQLLNLSLTDLSFKELVALFKRRRAVIIVTTLLFVALGVLVSAVMAPTWQALKVVVVEGKTQANPGGASDIVQAITQTGVDYDVLTQIQIMGSSDVFIKALQRINYPLKAQLTEDEVAKLPKVNVQQIQTTNTVAISVEDKDPTVAVELASMVPIVYQEKIVDKQQDQVKRALDFVSARIDEERKSLDLKQQEFSQYKQENNVADSKSEVEVRQGAFAEASRKYNESVSDVEAASAAVKSAFSQKESIPAQISNPTSITPVDPIYRAEEQLSNLEIQRAGLLEKNLEGSDRVLMVDAQIKMQRQRVQELKDKKQISADSTVRNPLKDELEKTYVMAKANLEASIAKRDSLRSIMEERRSDLRSLAPITAKQQEWETQLVEIETTITRLLEVQNNIRLRNNVIQSPIDDVTGKMPPKFIRPILTLNLALAALLGLFFGCVFALVRDVSLDKVNSSTEASMIADRDILGRIPLRASSREALIADPQRARAFEAYRILRSSILLAAPGKKVFLVTSTLPKEGKTTIAGNLAVAMALEGKRTILVDGSLRNPAVHKLFKIDQTKGVTDVLGGTATIEEALKTNDIANLAILTAGGEAANSTELVASDAMKDLIQKLSAQADVVIVDAPAAFGFADTQSLVTAVKDVLFVTQLESPGKSQMREAVGMIDFAGGSILGLILNKDKWAINRARGGA